jgi:hypothetical protein
MHFMLRLQHSSHPAPDRTFLPRLRGSTGLHVCEDGKAIGRMYEDRQTLPEQRWFWSITVYVGPKQGINTSGRAASLDETKAQFLSNWQSCRADSTPSGQRST